MIYYLLNQSPINTDRAFLILAKSHFLAIIYNYNKIKKLKIMEFKGIKQYNRVDVINSLIKENDLKSYLQVGETHSTGSQIICQYKEGIDWLKSNDGTYDKFYKGLPETFYETHDENQYDIIFIDGDHSLAKLNLDYEYALKHSKFIVVHDVLPVAEESTHWPNNTPNGDYHGDAFQLLLAYHYSECPFTIYNFDHGVLVIKVSDGDVNRNDIQKDKIPYLSFELFKDTNFNFADFPAKKEPIFELTEETKKVIEEQEVKTKQIRKPMSQETKDKIKASKSK